MGAVNCLLILTVVWQVNYSHYTLLGVKCSEIPEKTNLQLGRHKSTHNGPPMPPHSFWVDLKQPQYKYNDGQSHHWKPEMWPQLL